MKTTLATVLALTLTLLAQPHVMAQEEDPVERTLQDEVAELNRTMKTIAGLLEKQVEGQDTELLIRRFEWSNSVLSPKKERLRKAKTREVDLKEEEANLARTLEFMKEELAKQESEDSDRLEQLQITPMEQRIETIDRLRRDLAREVIELENEVAAQEETLGILEDVIDSRLGLR